MTARPDWHFYSLLIPNGQDTIYINQSANFIYATKGKELYNISPFISYQLTKQEKLKDIKGVTKIKGQKDKQWLSKHKD